MLGYRVGLIGSGTMASAILTGALRQDVLQAEYVYLSDPDTERTEPFRHHGVHTTLSDAEVVRAADLVVLAVKPQTLERVLPTIAPEVRGKCVVSLAPGLSSAYLRAQLPGACVLRAMSNLPLRVGKGMTAIARHPDTPAHYMDAVMELFSAAGETLLVEESQLNAVLALSGSSPAYFFRFAEAMTQEGERMGLTREEAAKLAAQSMRGAAAMLLHSGRTAEELTRQACASSGTVQAALEAFDEGDLEGLVSDAMRRCVRRAEELER